MQTIEKPSSIGKFRRSIINILEDFSKPIPARLIKKKPVFSRRNGQLIKSGGVDYIPWSTYIRLLGGKTTYVQKGTRCEVLLSSIRPEILKAL